MGASSFVDAMVELQNKCQVRNLKMSDYSITESMLGPIVKNAYDTMGFLFELDPVELSKEETDQIIQESFR